MNREEARQILALWRNSERDRLDPFFAEALKLAEGDAELARWFADEQEFDRAFAAKLTATALPADLHKRVRAVSHLRIDQRFLWFRRVTLAAAAVLVLALLFATTLRRGASLDDFRSEMISFVKLTPPLELESADLERIEKWIGDANAPSPTTSAIPTGLNALDPAGCRVLFYRGHKVTLICFKRGNGKLAHLLVIDRAALPRLPRKSAPTFATEGEWMTAAWQDGNNAYVLAAQGDRELLERYLTRL